MRLFRSALVIVAVATSAGVGCGDDTPRGDVREWRASDHAQPANAAETPEAAGTPEEPSPEVLARAAAALYDVRCASCHGETGDGTGPEAPIPAMPDFRDEAFQVQRTDADLTRAIRMGQGLMPAFGGQLNERGILALVGHIRTLRQAD